MARKAMGALANSVDSSQRVLKETLMSSILRPENLQRRVNDLLGRRACLNSRANRVIKTVYELDRQIRVMRNAQAFRRDLRHPVHDILALSAKLLEQKAKWIRIRARIAKLNLELKDLEAQALRE